MSNYVFDPKVIDEIARKHLGKPLEQMFADIGVELAETYPGAIDQTRPWVFNNAGGVMLEMKLFHASHKEYIMIWGTPIGSEGHTGRHLSEFHDTVLDGEAWYYSEGELTRHEYKPGDYIFVGKGESAGMHYPDHVWMIEYARGSLLTILPFGLADGLFSTLDYKTLWNTVVLYFSLLFQSFSKPQKIAVGTLAALAPVMMLSVFAKSRRQKRVR